MWIHSKQPPSLLVGRNPPVLCVCKVEARRTLQRSLQNQGYACLAQLLPPYPVGPHQPPRMSDIVLELQKTCQCVFLLNCKHLAPEIWLQDSGTELYNDSLISNFISTLQDHHPNKLFLHFYSHTLWATFRLVFLEWDISSCFKCAAQMCLIYCTYGTKMGEKGSYYSPEAARKYTAVQQKAKQGICVFLVREERVADSTWVRCHFSVSRVVQFLKALLLLFCF